MAKLKDILIEIAKRTKNAEVEALATSGQVQELEISDEAVNSVRDALGSLVTIEEAVGIPEVKTKIKTELLPIHRKSILQEFEQDQEEMVREMLGERRVAELKGKPAEERMRMITGWMKEKKAQLEETQNKGDQELQNQLKAALDKLSVANQTIEQKDSEYQSKYKELENNYTQTLINKEVQRMASSYPWLEQFDDKAKKAIVNMTLGEISGKAILKPTDTGEISIFDKENPDMEYHNGPKKVPFKELFEQSLSPYLKKNDAGNNRNGQPAGPQPEGGRQQQISDAYQRYQQQGRGANPNVRQPKPGTLEYERWAQFNQAG